MSEIKIVREVPHTPERVWRAMTDPELIPRWTETGAGARPVGFVPEPGNRFQFRARPRPGWNGVVDCVVLEANAPCLLRYSWTGGDGGGTTEVTYRIEPYDGGTRLTYEHTGFTGVGGVFMARLLGRVRRRMLTTGLPAVLADLDRQER